ncbi:MAG: hypothetical protein AABY75_02950 [Bacteroidota bacterium]
MNEDWYALAEMERACGSGRGGSLERFLATHPLPQDRFDHINVSAAAAALVAAGLSSSLREGVEQSLAAVRSGAAASLLARWSEATRSFA